MLWEHPERTDVSLTKARPTGDDVIDGHPCPLLVSLICSASSLIDVEMSMSGFITGAVLRPQAGTGGSREVVDQ